MSWYDSIGNAASYVFPVTATASGVGSLWNSTVGNDPGGDAEKLRKQQLYQQAAQAGQYAQQGQNAWAGYNQQGQGVLAALQRQAQGGSSVSAEQLRQGLQQNQATQMSMAAGASPQNAAMAARTAAIQSGRLGAGLAGQQAVAGLQERNQAQQQYAGLLQGLSGQAANIGLGAQQAAIQGYGASNAGAPERSWLDKYGGAIIAGAKIAAA